MRVYAATPPPGSPRFHLNPESFPSFSMSRGHAGATPGSCLSSSRPPPRAPEQWGQGGESMNGRARLPRGRGSQHPAGPGQRHPREADAHPSAQARRVAGSGPRGLRPEPGTPGPARGAGRGGRKPALRSSGPSPVAQGLTAAVARLCMLEAAATVLPPLEAPDTRSGLSAFTSEDEEELRQPPSASASLRPLHGPPTFHS